MTNKYQKGLLLALTTAFISGFAIFFSKIAVKIADPLVHVSLRTAVVAAVLSLLMNRQGKFSQLKKYSSKEKFLLLLVGLAGGSLPFILFFTGLSKTTAVSGALIHKTLYIWVALLAIPLLGERLNFLQGVGYGLVLLSNMVIGGWQGFNFGLGELMVLTATVLWAIENVIAKFALKTIDSISVAWARLTIGSSIILITALLMGKGSLLISLTPAQLFTILGGATTLFFYVITWYKALSLAPATHVSAVLTLGAVVTNILSAIFITHTLSSPQIINTTLLLAGVICIIMFAEKYLSPRRLKTI